MILLVFNAVVHSVGDAPFRGHADEAPTARSFTKRHVALAVPVPIGRVTRRAGPPALFRPLICCVVPVLVALRGWWNHFIGECWVRTQSAPIGAVYSVTYPTCLFRIGTVACMDAERVSHRRFAGLYGRSCGAPSGRASFQAIMQASRFISA